VRYDQIEPHWLDDSVAWFESRGVHPYLLVDEWEVEIFRQRFASAKMLGALDAPPLMTYEGGGRVTLYDLSNTRDSSAATLDIVETYSDRMRSTPPASRSPVTFPR